MGGEVFREWEGPSPQRFRLVYGDPVGSYPPPKGGPAPEMEQRACAGFKVRTGHGPRSSPAHRLTGLACLACLAAHGLQGYGLTGSTGHGPHWPSAL
jgi:hypothetical protein